MGGDFNEDHWTFRRTHTFFLSTNQLPKTAGSDEGIWRRIKLVPFEVDLREKVSPVPNFSEWLVVNEGSGILNWLIEGYRLYRREGLIEPESVVSANSDYRSQEDHLGHFVSDCCNVGNDLIGTATALFEAYQQWGGKWSKTAFGKALAERFDKDKPDAGSFRKRTIYHGIEVIE